MADYAFEGGGGLPGGGVDQGGQPPGEQPSSGPETPDQEAQRSSSEKQVGEQVAKQQQQAFDTMRTRRAFVAGLLAQGSTGAESTLRQSSLASNLT